MKDLTINVKWIIFKYKNEPFNYEWRAIKAPAPYDEVWLAFNGWNDPYVSAKTLGDLHLKLKQL